MIRSLGYVGIASSAPEDWRRFGTEILGMQEVPPVDGESLAFRMDDRVARIIIEQDERDGLAYLGWELAEPDELDELFRRLRDWGCDPIRASDEVRRSRGVQGLVQCFDPAGVQLEFFHGHLTVNEPFRPGRPISGFATGALGLGHLVLAVNDVAKLVQFYRNVLGFRLSDQLGSALYFLRCNPRHHSIGIAHADGETRLMHIMVEVGSLDDVGSALDLCLDHELAATTIGVHSNDRMTSFYVRTPSNFEVEYGWNGLLVDEETWTETTIDRPSVWGHRQIDMAHPPRPRPLQMLRQRP